MPLAANIKPCPDRQALQEHFSALKSGDSMVTSEQEAAISDISGIINRKMIQPAANLIADKKEKIKWFMLDKVDLSIL